MLIQADYDSHVKPDDEVCMCLHVSLRKIRSFLKRERPRAASQISECLGAGTGCGWCVPFLKELHRQCEEGESELDISGVEPADYARLRARYQETGDREEVPR